MDDRTLVTPADLERAIAIVQRLPKDQVTPALATEPVVQEYLQQKFQHIAGRMALCGVPTPLVQRIVHDVDRLTACAMTMLYIAYREMLADLLDDGDESVIGAADDQGHDEPDDDEFGDDEFGDDDDDDNAGAEVPA